MASPHLLALSHRTLCLCAHLDSLTRAHGVHFHGQLPPLTTDLAAWRHRTAVDAATASRLGVSLSIIWDDAELFVEPGDLPARAAIHGPALDVDVGTRLADHARTKALQVADAEAAWVWLENHGAVDMLVTVHQLELVEQLAAYETLFAGQLADAPRVQGLTFSTAEATPWHPDLESRSISTEPLQVRLPSPGNAGASGPGQAIQQPLLLDRVRTTFHLPVNQGPEATLMWQLVMHEPRWLDLALNALGVQCTAAGLLRTLDTSP